MILIWKFFWNVTKQKNIKRSQQLEFRSIWMNVLKLNSSILGPSEVLDGVSKLNPKSVLVVWIDQQENVHVDFDSNCKMKDICYLGKVVDIYVEATLTGKVG